MRQKLAIIGGGIAGITAGYLLHRDFDVTLFEKDNRVGGNAHTHQTGTGETIDIAVGSVVKQIGAKNFLKLCKAANVKMIRQFKNAYVSLHDLETQNGLYVTPLTLSGLWAQKFSLYRSFKMLRTLKSIHTLTTLLDKGQLSGLTLQEAFNLIPAMKRMEKFFIAAFLCTISCLTFEDILEGPAEYFIGKLKSFRLTDPLAIFFGNYFPKNFTQSYVEALSLPFREKTVLNAEIKSVTREGEAVQVKMKDGTVSVYDKIIFACNADQALALLEKPTADERKYLDAWKYKNVSMVVHQDNTHAPKRSLCQPWTAIQSPRNGNPHFSITYCCWLLGPATSNKSAFFSTQYPNFPIKEDAIDCEKHFRVPHVDFDSFPTIPKLPSLNGKLNSYFCGSHFGYCLHGHAVDSAIEVAAQLGVDLSPLDLDRNAFTAL